MKHQAFSLIELLVVIAIVGIVAAVAVPSYKDYSIKSRASSITKVIDGLVTKSIIFAQTKGRFPTAYDLGLNPIPDIITDLSIAATLNPYFRADGTPALTDGIAYPAQTLVTPTPNCGQYGTVYGSFNPEALGFTPDEADRAFFTCDMWHYHGVIYKQCFYGVGLASQGLVEIGGNGLSLTGNFMPGWINYNTTQGWDYNNFFTYEGNLDSFLNATCQ